MIDWWRGIKIQWVEWRAYQRTVWNIRRDKKAINRAIRRAQMKNESDRRTYYILKNLGGGFDEVNSNDLKNLKVKNIRYFPRYQDYNVMIRECFAIITSNQVVRNSYLDIMKTIKLEENDTEGQKNH